MHTHTHTHRRRRAEAASNAQQEVRAMRGELDYWHSIHNSLLAAQQQQQQHLPLHLQVCAARVCVFVCVCSCLRMLWVHMCGWVGLLRRRGMRASHSHSLLLAGSGVFLFVYAVGQYVCVCVGVEWERIDGLLIGKHPAQIMLALHQPVYLQVLCVCV